MIHEADSFSHGYVLTDRVDTVTPKEWSRVSFGQLLLACHQRTSFFVISDPGATYGVAFVGNPVDIDSDTSDLADISRFALDIYCDSGMQALIKYVAYLGGRFSAFLYDNDKLVAIPDCHASQSIFWRVADDGIALASHSVLVALILSLNPDQHSDLLLRDLKVIKRQGTRYYPGTKTAYEGVRLVFANCLLSVETKKRTSEHTRFYPFNDLPQSVSYEATYAEFSALFLKHMRLLCSFGRIGISLTAGKDSRVTLCAAKMLDVDNLFAFTFYQYLNPGKASDDLFGANEAAFNAGYQHRVIRWTPFIHSDRFDSIYNETWPRGGQSPATARALYEELPRGFFQLQSTIAETGTAFYKGRATKEISAYRLTALWQGSKIAEDNRFVSEFEEFIEYANFNENSLKNIDYHDAFYWEHRNTSWAANRYHEGDLGHRVLLPFNQRGIIEIMLSLPIEDRRSARILVDFAEKNAIY